MTDKPQKVTRKLAMLAKCHDCTGGYYDGKIDCEVTVCPLYPYMPYASNLPNEKWLDFNPKKKGNVRWEDCGKDMTDEQRQQAAERLRSYRKKSHKDELLEMAEEE